MIRLENGNVEFRGTIVDIMADTLLLVSTKEFISLLKDTVSIGPDGKLKELFQELYDLCKKFENFYKKELKGEQKDKTDD